MQNDCVSSEGTLNIFQCVIIVKGLFKFLNSILYTASLFYN
jgi:hypothetical protein